MAQTIDAVGMDGATRLTLFLDNHDVVRWLDETDAALGPAERLRRYHLALTALFTLPGIPQLYYGDELALTGGFPDNRRDMPAWAWSAAERGGAHPESIGDPAVTFELVRRLIALRGDTAALSHGSDAELWRPASDTADVFAFFRAAGDSRAVVAFNNSAAAVTVDAIPFHTSPGIRQADKLALPDGARLFDRLGRGAPPSLTITGGKLRVMLPAKSAAIYTP
jgi:glycosidase